MPTLVEKKDCCGCTACQQSCRHKAIRMVVDDEGFAYPQVDVNRCVECKLCEQVCPITKYDEISSKENDPLKIYGMINNDHNIHIQSSSGGVFSSIASWVIGSMSGVVYGAAYNESMTVIHKRIEHMEDICHLRGSKYVQSDLGDTFLNIKKDLTDGKTVLFSGTGCQVEGLQLFLHKNYDNLICVDFVCHGVPSPKLYAEYIRFLEHEYGSEVIELNMRDKERGWKQRYHYRVGFANGMSVFDTRRTNVWNRMFFSECITRPACHACRFTNYLRPSDITLSDFWNIQVSHPEFYNPKGVSMAMVNTMKGLNAIEMIKSNFNSIEVSKEDCYQPCLSYPTAPNPLRSVYWQDVKILTFKQLIKKYHGYSFFTYYWRLYRREFHLWRVRCFHL